MLRKVLLLLGLSVWDSMGRYLQNFDGIGMHWASEFHEFIFNPIGTSVKICEHNMNIYNESSKNNHFKLKDVDLAYGGLCPLQCMVKKE